MKLSNKLFLCFYFIFICSYSQTLIDVNEWVPADVINSHYISDNIKKDFSIKIVDSIAYKFVDFEIPENYNKIYCYYVQDSKIVFCHFTEENNKGHWRFSSISETIRLTYQKKSKTFFILILLYDNSYYLTNFSFSVK